MRGPIFTGFRWIWKPFGNPNFMTHLRPRKWHCDYDYPWQDINSLRWINMGKRVHDAYRRRSFFHTPWILPTNILTNETLATLLHPPSRAVQTPGQPPPRKPSRRQIFPDSACWINYCHTCSAFLTRKAKWRNSSQSAGVRTLIAVRWPYSCHLALQPASSMYSC